MSGDEDAPLRRRSSDERGAAAIETALVALPILVILLGIIELSFAFRDHVAVTSGTRSAARVAATGADAGACVSDADDDTTPCPAGQVPQLAQNAANAVARSGRGLDNEAIQYIMVFKANANGYPGNLTSMPASCAGISNCVSYTWRPLQNNGLGRFRYANGSWNPTTISACFPGTTSNPLDSVGVYIAAEHDFITGLFGDRIGLGDRAVMQFEPLPVATCKAGQHP